MCFEFHLRQKKGRHRGGEEDLVAVASLRFALGLSYQYGNPSGLDLRVLPSIIKLLWLRYY